MSDGVSDPGVYAGVSDESDRHADGRNRGRQQDMSQSDRDLGEEEEGGSSSEEEDQGEDAALRSLSLEMEDEEEEGLEGAVFHGLMLLQHCRGARRSRGGVS
jgi:hypothetical protein